MIDNTEQRLIEFVAQDKHHSLRFVNSAYSWNRHDLSGSIGPRKWQAEVLSTIDAHLQNPETRYQPLRIAVASGHGVGKSGLIGMITNWGMSTCSDCKIVVTASTETQLRTKTWPEISKWFRMSLNAHWFNVTATSIASISTTHSKTWRADAIAWSENNTEAFAGLHNKGRRIIVIYDEASAIADKVWEVTEGALTDEDTEIIWIAFGNPTQNTGRFRECFGRFKHRWVTKQIDSRTVEGTNKKEFEQWVKDYGEDSDFVRVRVKGEFPRSGSMQFIPSDTVDMARHRTPEANLYDPLVMGVDVARFGDDQTVIVVRRGRDAKSVPWITLRGADTMTVAARVVNLAQEYKVDAIFVDGGGVGGGVVDRLRMLRQPVIEVQFGASPDKDLNGESGPIAYANKRAEMWGTMRDWMKGGAIPDNPDLGSELTGVQYSYTMKDGRDAILLEKKSDMKKRGLASPDLADALALTFAYAVQPSDHSAAFNKQSMNQSSYDPLGKDYLKQDFGGSNGVSSGGSHIQNKFDYDPLSRNAWKN